MASFNATPDGPTLPPVDARLAVPGARHEVLDGVLVHVPPADEPHGTRHVQVSALVVAHAAPGFKVACDMLTRTSLTSDIAPDVSVFPLARDPVSGGRQLEHLAFEVVSTQSLGHAGRKAARLAARGVRRVFAIDVERGRVLEWASALATWSVLDTTAHIADHALGAPLPVAALLEVARTDDAVARALILKRNPEIEAVKARAESDGKRQGRREAARDALLATLTARGIAVTERDRARILGEPDPDRLLAWIARAATCATLAEVLGEP
jgi:Uma2 family endonuclease